MEILFLYWDFYKCYKKN